ncbi:glutathione S-transferase [Bosea caraganae]|uniref:Glutathione S-transferase n=1 Tax=Bosea caraganae TaxID=2763117 RepID=A0A370L9J9_9HYPH|nr:glutathione S-transferase N-terminal domain-containing protein [Bosea caraganae]RDJ26957.1 glutathione S-transferase [Bosea caraganae]RDJ30844.1 glutathione S-transferase [Bosea caraganae]
MKLYIANKTCSEAVQIIANELGLNLELIHYDVAGKTTSNNDDFLTVNPLGYVPVLVLDDGKHEPLTETIVLASYLADQHPEAGLLPARGTLDRVRHEQLLVFIATEIAQKHIPLMRKLMTEEGIAWARSKIVTAYKVFDDRLADGRPFLEGDRLTVADAYLWGTFWHERSGARIDHLNHVMAWKARMDALPSVQKAVRDEAEIVARHTAQISRQAA